MSQTRIGRGGKVLLVDDEKHVLHAMADLLTAEGFEVTKTASAEEALRVLDDVKPDVVVLDISMPGMGGMGFLREIKGTGDELRYPVLVLTARANLKEFFDEVKVDDFLAKPCEGIELVSRLRMIIGRHMPEEPEENPQKRVFIAEDDPDALSIVRRAFKRSGYHVTSVESGPAALEKVHAVHPDIIFVKHVLTGMNGPLLAPLFAAMPGTRRVPVVIYDGIGSLPESGRASEHVPPGVWRWLRAPDPISLVRAADDLLGDSDSPSDKS